MIQIDTKVWKIDSHSATAQHPAILEVAERLKHGEIIAFPTETVYGLGADALNEEAVKNIFIAKGRPNDNPLIVHIASKDQLPILVETINTKSMQLMDAFWPGPLTVIFPKKKEVPNYVTGGLSTVAVRMPNHPVALAIIKAANLPIAAPSANKSGKPSPTTSRHVMQDLKGFIDGIVDSGPTGIGVESTVIDVSEEIPIVLRPGGITIEELEAVIGKVQLDPAILKLKETDKPRSPGMKYKHYAPKGEVLIIQGKEDKILQEINQLASSYVAQGRKVGILTLEKHRDFIQLGNVKLAYGTEENLFPLAEHLYDALRIFDDNDIDIILMEGVKEEGIGLAIMNRMKKASGGNIKILA